MNKSPLGFDAVRCTLAPRIQSTSGFISEAISHQVGYADNHHAELSNLSDDELQQLKSALEATQRADADGA